MRDHALLDLPCSWQCDHSVAAASQTRGVLELGPEYLLILNTVSSEFSDAKLNTNALAPSPSTGVALQPVLPTSAFFVVQSTFDIVSYECLTTSLKTSALLRAKQPANPWSN